MQKICIIIPCFNEAERLKQDVFCQYVKQNEGVDFLFVNDGSSDRTESVLEKLAEGSKDRMQVFSLKENSGKAEAVRQGVNEACKNKSYTYIGFWDADLATPLSEINHFMEYLKDPDKKIAIGSRIKRLGSTVDRKRSRHLLGRVFSTFASLILKLPVYDTQCGAKIFSSELSGLFSETFSTRWLFDIELLARYRNKYDLKTTLDTVVEVPVNEWKEVGGSKLKLSYMMKVPIELIKINKRYN